MNKLLFILLILFWVPMHTQTNTNDTRIFKNLRIKLETGSGNLLGNTARRIFEGNFTSYQINYLQNFSSAKWFSIGATLELISTSTWDYKEEFPTDITRLAFSGYEISLDFIFYNILNINFNSMGLMNVEVAHDFVLPRNSFVGFDTGVEFFFTGTRGLGSIDFFASLDDFIREGEGFVLNLFYSTFNYGVNIAKGWYFSGALQIRSGGDSAYFFKRNFYLRWDNTFGLNKDNWKLWATLRFEPRNILLKETYRRYDIGIVAGVQYTFDIQSYLDR